MSYEENSKLYPDFKSGVTTYHNADKFFGYEAPEDLQKFLQEQNISDATVYVEIGNKKVPFVKGSEGYLTPIEATRVMGLIDSYRRTLELTDIETRIATLEANLANSA